jgi:hypothetical protein
MRFTLIIITILSTLVNALDVKTIKLTVEYSKSNHYCLNERQKTNEISSLIDEYKKEGYYYTSHETTSITNSVKIVPTKHDVIYYHYTVITIDVTLSEVSNTKIYEIKMSEECTNYFAELVEQKKTDATGGGLLILTLISCVIYIINY